MSTAEELFKEAARTMESGILIPVVLQKCAERGYQPQTEEEAGEILKIAGEIRQGLMSGQIAPIPAAYLQEDGEMSKQASEAVQQDFLTFAGPVEINLDAMEDGVKEAAAIMAWQGMEQMAESQKEESK